MAVTLPYVFHTDNTARLIFKCGLGMTGIVMIGVIKFLILGNIPSLLGCILLSGIIIAFTLIVFKNVGGSSGSITHGEVIVEPTRILGVSSGSPEGRYALTQFKALRIENFIGGPVGNGQMTRPHERIYLVGSDATPDILIARTALRQGVELVRQFSETLGLPVEETHPAY
jgi:hypothetical protein